MQFTMIIIRFLDVVLGLIGIVIAVPLLVVIYILGYFDTGSPLFIQERVGRKKQPFNLIKFRTMALDTESVATHLANSNSITPLGRFLRRSKLDELPQLVNVIKGDMSLVGPRPCLYNQHELIAERSYRGVFDVLPGVTGLSQINGVDMSNARRLAEWDQKMIQSLGVRSYFRCLIQTVLGKGAGDRIRAD